MKIYWWQGGLHIEPENEQEVAALGLIGSNLVNVDEGVPTGPIDESNNQKTVVGV